MEKLILVIHSLSALFIIFFILMQQGKGAAAGASFGAGASQTVFGSDGGSSFFTRITAILATIFFCTSLGLAMLAKSNSKITTEGVPLPSAVQQAPAAPVSDVPASPAPVNDIPAVNPAAGTATQNQTAPAATDVPVVPASPAQ
jgi:preprotein translocase subunit SecG